MSTTKKKSGLLFFIGIFITLISMLISVRVFAADQTITKREKYGLIINDYPEPTKIGYNFDGWYTAASGGTKINTSTWTTPLAENTDLYAHWKPHEYNLTFNDGRESRSSGTLPGTVRVKFDCQGNIPSTGALGPIRGSIRFDPNGGSGGRDAIQLCQAKPMEHS